jgi:hypothetical protein
MLIADVALQVPELRLVALLNWREQGLGGSGNFETGSEKQTP